MFYCYYFSLFFFSLFFLLLLRPPTSPLFPYTTLFRSFRPLIAVAVGDVVGNERDITCSRVPYCDSCVGPRSEEHTSELQSHSDLVCRLLLEKKNKIKK